MEKPARATRECTSFLHQHREWNTPEHLVTGKRKTVLGKLWLKNHTFGIYNSQVFNDIFFILIVRPLLVTELSTNFSVFPVMTKSTRRMWPISGGFILLHDTKSYLFCFKEVHVCSASILYFSFGLFTLNTVRYHHISCNWNAKIQSIMAAAAICY